MGFFGCHQVAVSEARATIILAETTDAEEVAKVQTLLASAATESKFRVVIILHVGFVLHMVLMCARNSNGTWSYDMSSLRGAISSCCGAYIAYMFLGGLHTPLFLLLFVVNFLQFDEMLLLLLSVLMRSLYGRVIQGQ
jgi:hypothetical protein